MNSDNVGGVQYDARITTGQLKKDAASAESIVKSTAKNLGAEVDKSESVASRALGNVMNKVKFAAAATATAISAAGVAAATFGVKSAADFQQTRIGLENMLGSADKARSLLGDISKFAADTPFEFPELAQATRQLVAFGFSGEDAFNTMKQLGDVSAAVGAPINDLAYLMGTLRTQGRAFTVDIRQFAQRGIPIYEYLAKVLKTSEKNISSMIEAGKIGFPEVQKAFAAMTGEGGKFNNTMEKQSKSLSGIFSTLKDNIGQTVREMVGITQGGDIKEGSLFDFLAKGGAKAVEELPRTIERIGMAIGALRRGLMGGDLTSSGWFGRLEEIGKTIREVFDYLAPKFTTLARSVREELLPILKDLWKNVIQPMIPVIGVALVASIGLVTDAVNFLVDGIGWLYQAFKDGNPIILGLAAVFGTLATAMAFNAVFNALIIGFNTLTLITIPSVMASVSALKAAIASPVVLGAIGIGAALAAILAVQQALDKLKKDIDATYNRANASINASSEAIKKLTELSRNGTPEQKARAKTALQNLANSGGFASGGYTGSGPKNEVAGLVHRGEYVLPKDAVDQATGLPKTGGANITINMSGIMARSRSDLRDIGKDIIQAVNEDLRARGIAEIGGGQLTGGLI